MSYEQFEKTPMSFEYRRDFIKNEIDTLTKGMRNVFAYLCQTRKIDSKLVEALVREGLLYQDKHVFL